MKKILLFVLAFSIKTGMHAATFTSIASGNFNASTTWSFTGTDTDGIPDQTDDVTITAGRTVTLNSTANAKTLTINATGVLAMNNNQMLVWGNFTNNGSTSGNGTWQFRSLGTFSGNGISNNGTIYFFSTYTIAAGVSISKPGYIVVSYNCTVTNKGSINLTANGVLNIYSGGKWINSTGSTLAVSGNVINSGIIDASAVPNNFIYNTAAYNSVMGTNATYYNLTLNSSIAATKSITGNLTVLNNLTIGSNVTLNWSGNNINLGGTWSNLANTTCTNMGTITFNGSGTQTITRSVATREFFNNMDVSGTGTVSLNDTLVLNGNLNINSGTLDVTAGNFTLKVAGNFAHNGGTFNARTGLVKFNGSAAQTISGSSTTTFNNITSNNSLGGVSVTGIIIINGILQVDNRSFGTSGFGSIILTATGPTTYAKIGPLGSGASLVGTAWTIGSYIDGPATAYWQYLGSPVSGTTLADWDNDARFYMSGVGGNDGNACCPIFYSVRTYSPVTNTYSNITSTSTTLTPAKGYMVWMSDNTTSLTAPLPYDTKGTPNQGTVTLAVTAGGPGNGYNLVSNPYACPVTYSSVVATSGNLHPDFLILMETGSYTTNPNGGVIAPNQGFMAIALSSGTIKFLESAKTTSSNPNIIRTAYPENYLRITASNGINGLGGEAVVQISNDSHNGKDLAIDMPFLASPYDDATNIWTSDNDGEDLLLNAMDGFQPSLDIPLFVKSGTPGTQLLSFKGLNSFSAYSCAYLTDPATGERINLKEHDTYSYEASAAGEKHSFMLHFERNGNCPLNEQQIAQSLDASSQVFTNNGNILVKFGFEESADVVVTVLDITGQEVVAPKSYTVTSETIAVGNPDAHGIYLVRIAKGKEISTKKIYY